MKADDTAYPSTMYDRDSIGELQPRWGLNN